MDERTAVTTRATLIDAAARLSRFGVPYALVGGLAVSIRAEIRFTRDVDLAVLVEADADLERLTGLLRGEGFRLLAVVEQDERQRIAIARLHAPSGIVLDLLAASSGIEAETVLAATETPEMPGIPVARAEHLVALKVLSMRDARLQDRIDVHSLLAVGSLDLALVRSLLDLITARGFARGQDLHAKLAAVLAPPHPDVG